MSAEAWATRATGPSSSTTGLADGSIRQADGFVTLDLRAGVYLGRWSVELYGKNLTNERGVTLHRRARPPPEWRASAWA